MSRGVRSSEKFFISLSSIQSCGLWIVVIKFQLWFYFNKKASPVVLAVDLLVCFKCGS